MLSFLEGSSVTEFSLSQEVESLMPLLKECRTKRVCYQLPNSARTLAFFLSIVASGLVACPLPLGIGHVERARMLRRHGCCSIFLAEGCDDVDNEFAENGIEIKRININCKSFAHDFDSCRDRETVRRILVDKADDERPVLELQTSGTTGISKIVELSVKQLYQSATNIADSYGLVDGDVTLVVMPLSHIHGLVAGCLASLIAGTRLIIREGGFNKANFNDDILISRPTWVTGSPSVFQLAMRASRPENGFPELRFLRTCSSPLSSQSKIDIQSYFCCPVLQAYGMTEAAHQISTQRIEDDPNLLDVGTPHESTSIRICSEKWVKLPVGVEGRVCIAGPHVIRSYKPADDGTPVDEEAFSPEGFLYTGDLGLISDGRLILKGREKEFINIGGEKHNPTEIDIAMNTDPHIKEAMAFGVPHDIMGETVAVCIVTTHGNVLTVDQHCQLVIGLGRQLPRKSIPSYWIFVDDIPRNALGKPSRLIAQAQFNEGNFVCTQFI